MKDGTMKDGTFRKAHRFTSRWETGTAGGPAFTRGGLSFALLRERGFSVGEPAPRLNVAALTPSRAAARLRCAFRGHLSLDDTPPRCTMVLYDTAVSMDVPCAAAMARQALGVPSGSRWLPALNAALRRCDDTKTAAAICHLRRAFYCDLVRRRPDLADCLPGWLGRVDALEETVLHERPRHR